MEVRILSLDYYMEMPIATVVGTTGNVFRLCLLHRSFLRRHRMGIGSRLQVTETGYFIKVLEATGYPTSPNTTRTIFDTWFNLYNTIKPFVSKRVARILFLYGLQTVDAIGSYRHCVEQIHGIGPVTARRIRTMCNSLLPHEIQGPKKSCLKHRC